MLRPGTAAFRPEALWILFAALCFAIAMLYTRRMAATETNVAMFAFLVRAFVIRVCFSAFSHICFVVVVVSKVKSPSGVSDGLVS